MSFASSTEWDCRSTGSDSNGGAWDTASSGTDYSIQDSPQVVYTDLAIDATTNTKVTSAGTPFTSAHVGNLINITSGTGFTVQRVQVVSVTSSVATCDKSLGTLSSTGGNGNLGGALANLSTAFTAAQSGSTANTLIHLKSGTYTRTTTWTLSPTSGHFVVIGYGTSHNDGGTRPLITSATNSVTLVAVGTGTNDYLFQNVSFSHTASTRGILVKSSASGAYPNIMFDGCVFDGGSYAVIADNSVANAGNISMWNCEVKNCTTGGVVAWFALYVYNSYIHDNTGSAIKKVSNQDDALHVSGCILTGNTKGVEVNGYVPGGGGTSSNTIGLSIIRCTIASNTSDGIAFTTNSGLRPVQIENTILYNNGGYGINAAFSLKASLYINKNNAFGSNTSGNANNWTTGANPVTLTATPFTSAGTGDYSLNSTAGGGAACKAAGFPGVFPAGTSTGSLDIGAVQSVGTGGGGGTSNFGFIG